MFLSIKMEPERQIMMIRNGVYFPLLFLIFTERKTIFLDIIRIQIDQTYLRLGHTRVMMMRDKFL